MFHIYSTQYMGDVEIINIILFPNTCLSQRNDIFKGRLGTGFWLRALLEGFGKSIMSLEEREKVEGRRERRARRREARERYAEKREGVKG